MRKLIVLLVAGIMLGLATMATMATVAQAAQPLVDAAWVKDNIGKPGVVFLDVRGKIDYMRGHVPGALNTNLGGDGWRVRDANGVPGMLGKPDDLAKLIGGYGIDNSTHVVLVPWGYSAGDMGTATRIYWTFKVLGHDAVSIVNGGMATYPGGFPTAREKYGVSHMQGDYAKIAEGMGAVGITVKKVAEMAPALTEAQRLNADGQTVLIDVHSNMEAKKSRY